MQTSGKQCNLCLMKAAKPVVEILNYVLGECCVIHATRPKAGWGTGWSHGGLSLQCPLSQVKYYRRRLHLRTLYVSINTPILWTTRRLHPGTGRKSTLSSTLRCHSSVCGVQPGHPYLLPQRWTRTWYISKTPRSLPLFVCNEFAMGLLQLNMWVLIFQF